MYIYVCIPTYIFDVDCFKSLYWICSNIASVFSLFGCKACGILAVRPVIEPTLPPLEREDFTTNKGAKHTLFANFKHSCITLGLKRKIKRESTYYLGKETRKKMVKHILGTSLVVQWLRFHLPMHGLPWWHRRWRIRLQRGRPGLSPWVGKISWRREWQPTPVLLPGHSGNPPQCSCLENPMDRGVW